MENKISKITTASELVKSKSYSHMDRYDLVSALPNALTYIKPIDKNVFGDITVQDIKSYSLTALDREICLAHFSISKIREMDENDAGAVLRQAISRAIFESGIGVKEEDIVTITKVVGKDILRDYSFMTTEEVSIAFRMGVREEWGELRGMNVRQFYVWLRKYNQHVKKEAISRLQLASKPKEIVRTEEERKLIRKSWLNLWSINYDEWVTGKDVLLGDAGNIFYNYICDNEIIVLTLEEKKDLYKQAEILFKHKHSAKSAGSKSERDSFVETLVKLQKGDLSTIERVKSEAKSLAIRLLFSRLKMEKKNLRDVISQIEK